MELRVGASTLKARRALARLVAEYGRTGRVLAPSPLALERAGGVLASLRVRGLEVRRASLVNDVLIAMTARSIGATVESTDTDFTRIREVDDFALENLPA